MATRPNTDLYRWGWGTHPVPPPGRTRRPRSQARPHGEMTSLATVLVARAWAAVTRASLAFARVRSVR